MPLLQILDVGSNGCLDAQLLGGTFSDDIAPISVDQIQTPNVPLYKIQTTTDIPYNASSEDMKAALEGLSQACMVDVSRRIDRNGYLRDVTLLRLREALFQNCLRFPQMVKIYQQMLTLAFLSLTFNMLRCLH